MAKHSKVKWHSFTIMCRGCWSACSVTRAEQLNLIGAEKFRFCTLSLIQGILTDWYIIGEEEVHKTVEVHQVGTLCSQVFDLLRDFRIDDLLFEVSVDVEIEAAETQVSWIVIEALPR